VRRFDSYRGHLAGHLEKRAAILKPPRLAGWTGCAALAGSLLGVLVRLAFA
jgi:hypothetical protein